MDPMEKNMIRLVPKHNHHGCAWGRGSCDIMRGDREGVVSRGQVCVSRGRLGAAIQVLTSLYLC